MDHLNVFPLWASVVFKDSLRCFLAPPPLLSGHVALSLVSQCALGVDQGNQRSLPKSVIDVCRMVYQAKCSLIKVGYIYIYIYIYIMFVLCVCVCIYIIIYIHFLIDLLYIDRYI